MGIEVSNIVLVVFVVLIIYVVFLSIKIVPQSKVFVIERFGKFTRILESGLSLIVPFVDRVAFKVDILERQLPPFKMSVITEDNVEVELVATVFFRVLDAAKSVYRIRNIDLAIENTAISVVRSAAGKLELDDLQSSREAMNQEIAARLSKAAEVWGVEVTRTEILDVLVDEKTKESQRQQLNAERERRAAIARAEGDKRSVELKADAELYEAKKQAEAVKVEADAEAYAVKIKAEADAKQTELIAEAINNDGQSAINYEIMKRQVEGLSDIASSNQTKTLFIPSDITKALGTLELFLDGIVNKEAKNDN
jgi:regulator of protease activity HflC (stomatin/prohibitin superfamily)